jgi:hypothetical protein
VEAERTVIGGRHGPARIRCLIIATPAITTGVHTRGLGYSAHTISVPRIRLRVSEEWRSVRTRGHESVSDGYARRMTHTDRPRTGELPIDPASKGEEGAPVDQTEPGRPVDGLPEADSVTEPDGSGASGGSSGGSGGGSGMPGHPDAVR